METEIKKGGELKNIKVKVLSLVDKAANLRELVWKSETFGSMPDVNYFCEIKKVDDEKHLIYCPVYCPNEKDAHEDWATAEEIEKAAHDFLKESKTYAIDTNHNMELAEGCSIVESAILKGTHEYLADEKAGTWYVAMKIENDEVWKGVKDGTYKGVSLYGFATRIADETESNDEMKGFFKAVKKFFMGEGKPEISKAGKTISAANRKKLEDAIGVIQSLLDAADGAEEKSITKQEFEKNKNKITKQEFGNQEDNNNMETIEKTKYDADIAAKDADLKAKQDEIDKITKERDDALAKSKGTKQVDGDAPADGKDTKPVYKWLGGQIQAKQS